MAELTEDVNEQRVDVALVVTWEYPWQIDVGWPRVALKMDVSYLHQHCAVNVDS